MFRCIGCVMTLRCTSDLLIKKERERKAPKRTMGVYKKPSFGHDNPRI